MKLNLIASIQSKDSRQGEICVGRIAGVVCIKPIFCRLTHRQFVNGDSPERLLNKNTHYYLMLNFFEMSNSTFD